MAGDIQISLSPDDALVLLELLSRSSDAVQPLEPGEQNAIWHLEAALERVVSETFTPEYRGLLDAARVRLAQQSPPTGDVRPTVCFVDVDDTLVRTFGSKRIPIGGAIERTRELHQLGAQLYCWSTGGAAYAFHAATELGLQECFVAFLPKPQVLIDDQLPAEWRGLVCFHPNEAVSMSADEILAAASPPKTAPTPTGAV